MDDIAIKVSELDKSFKLPHEKQGSIKNAVIGVFNGNRTFERQKVLKNINLEIKKGEFFGIVGKNGGGKSTILKLLAGIYSPDEGAVVVNGKLTAFIELGVGFNPELTGRENIFLSGALLGFSEKEVSQMYDEIVDFAELHRFMDQKLKNYSSGMQVRLAFSIAIRAKSDILILDEVLAVGDEAFQRKCMDVFEKYKSEKQTVILVTHDMETVRNFCSRAALINNGIIEKIGNPREIALRYSELNQELIDNNQTIFTDSSESNKLEATITDSSYKKKNRFNLNETLQVNISWNNLDTESIESIGVNIFKNTGEHITGINSRTGNLNNHWVNNKEISIEFELNIKPGRYYIFIEIFDTKGKVIAFLNVEQQFTVSDRVMEWSGLTELKHSWIVKSE